MLARHPGGRPLTLTPALVETIAAAVRNGVPIETAARCAGVSDRTLEDWLSVGRGTKQTWRSGQDVDEQSLAVCKSLARSVGLARAELEAELATATLEMAREGTKADTVRLKAMTTLLQIHPSYRDRWGQHVTIQQTGQVDHRHLHVELSTEEARAMAERLHQQELPSPEAPGGGKGSGGVEEQYREGELLPTEVSSNG